MDDEWYRIVRNFSPICAPEEWRVEDIAQWLSGAAVLVAAAPVMPPGLARLARAIVLVGLLGVAVSAAGAELRIAALVQTQPWRAMWLVSWFAPLATLYWFRGADAQAPARRILMFGTLAVLALTPFYWTAVGAVVGLLHAGVLVVFVVWDVPTIRPPSVRFAALWTFAMFTVAVVLAGVEVIALTSVEGRNFEHLRLFRVEVASVFGWCLLPAIVVAVALFVRLVREGRGFALPWRS